MAVSSKVIRELLENGVHFGHQTNKWNPKMEKYIFGEKSGIYIIDLKKTEQALAEAVTFIYSLAAKGGTVLFTGTKKQARQTIREEAQRCDMFFVDERWLGGCLTNFATIRKSVEKLNHLQEIKSGEVYETLAKKEKASIDKAEYKLLRNLEGIRNMDKLPDCLVVVDAEAGDIAIREANKIGIPVIALLDTNCDPDKVQYPIPGNDDAIRAIKYIVATLASAVKKGRNEFMGITESAEEAEVEAIEKKEIEAMEKEQEENRSEQPHVDEKTETKESEEEQPAEEDTPDEHIVRKSAAEEDVADGDIQLDNS